MDRSPRRRSRRASPGTPPPPPPPGARSRPPTRAGGPARAATASTARGSAAGAPRRPAPARPARRRRSGERSSCPAARRSSVHPLPAEVGALDLDLGDLVERAGEDVPVEDDQVRQLPFLEGPGVRILGQDVGVV